MTSAITSTCQINQPKRKENMKNTTLIYCALILSLSSISLSIKAKTITGSIEDGLTVHGVSVRTTYDLNNEQNSEGYFYFKKNDRGNIIQKQCSSRSLGENINTRRKKTIVHGNGVHEIYARYKSQSAFNVYDALLQNGDGQERRVAKILVDDEGYVVGVSSKHKYSDGIKYERVKSAVIRQLGKPKIIDDRGDYVTLIYGLSEKQTKTISQYRDSLSKFANALTEEYVRDLPKHAAIISINNGRHLGTSVNIILIDNPRYLVTKHDEVVERCLEERKSHYDKLLTQKEKAKEKARKEFEL